MDGWMTSYNLLAHRKMGGVPIENESSVKWKKEHISEIRVSTLPEACARKITLPHLGFPCTAEKTKQRVESTYAYHFEYC